MKTSAEKSSTSSKTSTAAQQQPFFSKAGGGDFFAPSVQMKMAVNKPGDKFEQEADKMADKVMRMPAPATAEKLQRAPAEKLQKKAQEKIQKTEDKLQKASQSEEKLQKKTDDLLQKAETKDEKLQRKGRDSAPTVSADTHSAIKRKTGGGQPLSADVRSYMETRFNADFNNIRVHHDAESAGISNQLNARAFTHRNHVFFSDNQYQPGTSEGKKLLAHELTHTIQQGHAVQRSPQVSTTATPPRIQRIAFELPDIDLPNPLEYLRNKVTDFIKEHAEKVPGFKMLTVVMGKNPITDTSVDRSPGNILQGAIEMIPVIGDYISQALSNHGIFDKVSAWTLQQFNTLKNIGSSVWEDIKSFIKRFSITQLKSPMAIWEDAKSIVTTPIKQIIAFAGNLVDGIAGLIKDAILKPMAAYAKANAPNGYALLSAILGQDPISGESVQPTAENIIGPFMKMIGQEEIWRNLKQGKAIERAWAWFQGVLSGLMDFAQTIPTKIVETLTSLTIQDIITLAGAFSKIVGTFAGIASKFMSWAFEQVLGLLEILFSVVAPGVMPYIKKAQAAFNNILKNPIGFVGNLVSAGKMGFQAFAANIVTHLKTALIKWITGPMGEAGVYIPQSFSLIEIVKLVLSVLGLTWQNIRSKLVKIIPEPILVGLEKTAGILVTLVKDGPAAAWEQIKTELTELKDQLISQVTQMVTVEVVKAAVTKLVTSLNPAGAVIQAIIAIYKTITFFIEKISQIAAVVASFIDSISAIAAGQIAGAAKKVEATMAKTLTVVIAFLAKLAGLGGIPGKIVGIIKKIRAPIDKGLDKIVGWLGNMLKKAGTAVLQTGVPQDPNKRLKLAASSAVFAAKKLSGKITKSMLSAALVVIKTRYGLQQIEPYEKDGQWWVKMVINPVVNQNLGVAAGSQTVPANAAVPNAGVSPVAVGTPVVYSMKNGQAIATRVTAINVTLSGQSLIGTQLEWHNAWVPNITFGTNWTAPPVPPFVAFASGPPRIIIDKAHLNSGSPASGNPPGWSSNGKWKARGHLVPRVLGGPGGVGSGNIVAMTHQANATNAGMRGVELALRDDIDNGAVYDVTVQTHYDASVQIPPVQVHVFSSRLYPSPQRPSSVPSSPYSFKNT